jgi:hypothetical protein
MNLNREVEFTHSSPPKRHFYSCKEHIKIYIKIHLKYRSYVFRSSNIIRELALNLAKVIFALKHSVKLRRYLFCGCVAACHGMACVSYAVQNATELHSAQPTTHTPFHDMLPHNRVINNDVISPNVLT